MVTDSLFFLFVCQLTPIFVSTVQLYHRWIMKLKSGGKHSIYHPATRNQSFHDFKSERNRIYFAKLHCFFLYTHNWKALSLYIYCIKPFCPYLKKKELLVISLHIRFKNSSTQFGLKCPDPNFYKLRCEKYYNVYSKSTS